MSVSVRAALPTILALAVVTAAYSNVGAGGFVWDDRPLILDEPAVHDVAPLRYFTQPFWQASPFNEGHNAYYRPLTTLTYALDWARGGGAAGPFHAVNLLLHLVACMLVAVLASVLGAGAIAAGLAAGVFGTLPRLTESVSWISGRTDVLATIFTLAAVALHASAPERALRRLLAGLLLFVGLFAKEVAVAGACGIVALEIARTRPRDWRRIAVGSAPAMIAVAAYVAVRLAALRAMPREGHIAGVGPAQRLLLPFEAVGHYTLMLLDPFRPRLQIGVIGHPSLAAALLGTAVLAALAIVAARLLPRAKPGHVAALAMAAAAIGLVLHVLPVRLNVVAADRFLYLPAAALSAVLASLLAGAAARARTAAAIAVLVALPPLALATFQRSAEWNDEVVLWRRAVETTPASNPLPIHEYASALARAGRYDDAIAYYQRAADVSTGHRRVTALIDVATTLSDKGDLDVAVERMRAAMALGPRLPSYHYNLAILEMRRLRFDVADAELERAIAMLPSYEVARDALAFVRAARDRWNALPPRTPKDPAALNARRALFFEDLGVPTEAARLWRNVVTDPSASADDLLRAAVFQIRRGDVAGARSALERAEARGADPAKLAELRVAVESGGTPHD